jgi:hypothetical protein
MKYPVRQFVSLEVALKALEPFVRDASQLQSGKPFNNFGEMRPREAWANWLVCIAANSTGEKDLTFTSDPIGGDGIIIDKKTCDVFPTEHIMVSRHGSEGKGTQTLVVAAIAQKQGKGGAAYASGKTLIVFLDSGSGEWFPNRTAKALPKPLDFAAVWVVDFQGVKDGCYTYGVTLLDVGNGDAPIWVIRVAADFGSWTVSRVQ